MANTSVEQVTYGGYPVYEFIEDHAPGDTHGADLFDPFTTPPGIWDLLSPGCGLPNPGAATLSHETVSVAPTGTSVVVLAALLDQGLGGQSFPAYSFSTDAGSRSACLETCAIFWPPVLTTQRPPPPNGTTANLVGIVIRPDGSLEVTYDDHPLYFFVQDAALPGSPGVAHGSGITLSAARST